MVPVKKLVYLKRSFVTHTPGTSLPLAKTWNILCILPIVPGATETFMKGLRVRFVIYLFKAFVRSPLMHTSSVRMSLGDHHFNRQVTTKFLPILQPYRIGDFLVSLGEKTPIIQSRNKPIPRPRLFPHNQNHEAFTCLHAHGQRPIFIQQGPIHRNGFLQYN